MFKSPFTETQMKARAVNHFGVTLMEYMRDERTTILAVHRSPRKGVLYITRGGQIGHFFLMVPFPGLARLHITAPLDYSKTGMNELLRKVPTFKEYPTVSYDVAIRTADDEVEAMSEWLAHRVILEAQGLEEIPIQDSPHPIAPDQKENKGVENLMAICWWRTAGSKVKEELMDMASREAAGSR